jgi:hypothetical protein
MTIVCWPAAMRSPRAQSASPNALHDSGKVQAHGSRPVSGRWRYGNCGVLGALHAPVHTAARTPAGSGRQS